MYFLQLESWLGLNVFLFLFCPGLPNLYFLSIWRSQCYTFFLAGDREQQRGRPGTENRALFCAVTLFGHPKPAPFQPAGGRCCLSAEQSRRASLPAGRHRPDAERGQGREDTSAGRAQGGGGALPRAAVLPPEPYPLPPRPATLLSAADSSLGPRPSKRIPADGHGPLDVSWQPCPRPPRGRGGGEEGPGSASRKGCSAPRPPPGSAPAARPHRGRACARWRAVGLEQGCGRRAERLSRAAAGPRSGRRCRGGSPAAAPAAAPPERGAGLGRG